MLDESSDDLNNLEEECRSEVMSRPNTQEFVHKQSIPYLGTCGESATACEQRFVPAFRNHTDGQVELARLPNGKPAAMHLICGLPHAWARKLDDAGSVVELIDTVEAGFVRNGRFYTRAEAAACARRP